MLFTSQPGMFSGCAATDRRHAADRSPSEAAADPPAQIELQARIDLGSGTLLGWQLLPDRRMRLGSPAGAALPRQDWLDAALAWAAQAQALGQALPLTLSLGPQALRDRALPDRLQFLLLQHGLPTSRLELAINAASLRGGDAAALAGLAALQRIGLPLMLADVDDADALHGGLSPHRWKLAAALVAALAEGNEPALSAVQDCIERAHRQGLRCIATGIDTPEQLRLLRRLRCDEGEGSLLARPQTAAQALTQLKGPWPWLPLIKPHTRSLSL